MATNLKYLIGFGVSALLLVLFLFTVDIRQMLDALAGANYWFLLPAVGAYLVSIYFRSLRWSVLLRHLKRVSTRRLYPVVVVGYMANNLLPMRLGELVRSYYLGEREGVSKTSALATVFVERLFDALVLLLFIAVITLFVPLSGLANSFSDQYGFPWVGVVALVSVPLIGAFAIGVMLAAYPARATDAVRWLVRPLPRRFQATATALTSRLFEGFAPLNDPRLLSTLFLLSLPIWLFETAVFYILGFPFGLDDAHENLATMAVTMVLVTAISNIGGSIPAAPGGLGLFDIIARETLVLGPLAAIERSVAAGFVLVVHAAMLLPMIVLGQAILWAGHISLGRLSRQEQEECDARSGRAEAADPGP